MSPRGIVRRRPVTPEARQLRRRLEYDLVEVYRGELSPTPLSSSSSDNDHHSPPPSPPVSLFGRYDSSDDDVALVPATPSPVYRRYPQPVLRYLDDSSAETVVLASTDTAMIHQGPQDSPSPPPLPPPAPPHHEFDVAGPSTLYTPPRPVIATRRYPATPRRNPPRPRWLSNRRSPSPPPPNPQ